jgi:hypothetical protein
MSTDPIVDYSAVNTTVNPTIPAGTPTFSKEIKISSGGVWIPTAVSFTKEAGYFTMPDPVTTTDASGATTSVIPTSGKITFWPQSSMTSTDGSTWTATAAVDMVKMEEYTYLLTGNVMVLTKGDGTTQTYILQVANPVATVAADAFFKSWKLPNDADPTTKVDLVLSAQPYTDYSVPSGATNPTIPADAPSYIKTTTIDLGTVTPWSIASYTREIGYFVLPAVDATTATRPATGTVTFWIQKTMTSTDGSTWTETTPAAGSTTMEEYTYSMNGNVMVFTRGDKTTLTYYTVIP